MKDKYIANGQFFSSFEEVEKYAKSKGLRITNTETIAPHRYLITLNQ